jgi:hypothetical protein
VNNQHFLENYAEETPLGKNDGIAMLDRLMLNLMSAYLHGREHFPDEVNQRFKILLTQHAYLHQGTSNMEIGSAVTRYLATEIWGGRMLSARIPTSCRKITVFGEMTLLQGLALFAPDLI